MHRFLSLYSSISHATVIPLTRARRPTYAEEHLDMSSALAAAAAATPSATSSASAKTTTTAAPLDDNLFAVLAEEITACDDKKAETDASASLYT